MADLSKALRALIENPDDLSTLPQLVARVEELENSISDYQIRINKLQEVNKSYLAQIPIPGQEPQNQNEEKEPTFEDAKNFLLQTLTGGK